MPPNKKLVAITVMYKVKGYNPGGGDWYWVKYDADYESMAQKVRSRAVLPVTAL